MAMQRVLVLVPFPFDENGVQNRRAQLDAVQVRDSLAFEYRPVKAVSNLFDSYYDYTLADLAMFEAGLAAQEEGYAAVCIDTMSDFGMNALRSVLDIPAIGSGRAIFLWALLLGNSFSVMTQWDPWKSLHEESLGECGLRDKCVSIRSPNIPPDVENLLGGNQEDVFPRFLACAEACVEDGAEVICLGSTTMHQLHKFLSDNLAVPVVNPGPLIYKLTEAVLDLGVSHSRAAYECALEAKSSLAHTILGGGSPYEKAMISGG